MKSLCFPRFVGYYLCIRKGVSHTNPKIFRNNMCRVMEVEATEPTDQVIIESILKGQGELYEEIIKRYKNSIYSLCMRMVRNSEDAKDLAQEAFIKAYQNLQKYNPEYKFSTWIFKVASNLCIDYLRKRKIQTLSYDDKISMPHDTVSAEDRYLHNCNRKQIEKAIQDLPADYRILIILYHKEGLSYEQMCKMLELPMSKVKNRLHRARNKLKEVLVDIKKEESAWTAQELQT